MRRTAVFTLLCLVTCNTLSAEEGWWSRFRRNYRCDYQRNACWPGPFLEMDRAAAVERLNLQVSNGWKKHNTLHGAHFDEESHSLNEVGKIKIMEVARLSPSLHRTIFVTKLSDAEKTAARVEAVKSFLAQADLERGAPNVIVIYQEAAEWPGENAQMVVEKYRAGVTEGGSSNGPYSNAVQGEGSQ